MRVAIAHDYLTQRGGAERVVMSLHRLYPDAPIFTALYDQGSTFPEFGACDVRTSFLQRLPHRTMSGRALLPLFPAALESFDLSGYDLVISSSSGFAHGVRAHGAHLVYCHTPPRFLYQVDQYLGPGGPLGAWARHPLAPVLGLLRRWDARAATRPHRYVANSAVTARRVSAIYGRQCRIVHPPVHVGHLLDPVGHPPARMARLAGQEFFLVVARLLPYKRIDLVVEACAMLGARLVVVGAGPAERDLRALAGRLGMAEGGRVEFVGTVDDAELAWLLRSCSAVVQAGEEDLGLVPLEASAAGAPVVAFAGGGALETVVDGTTGVFFDEQSPRALAKALVEVVERVWDGDAMCRHAKSFSEARFHAAIEAEAARLVASSPASLPRRRTLASISLVPPISPSPAVEGADEEEKEGEEAELAMEGTA